MPVPARRQTVPLDPIGGQTAQLRESIATMRDLRRLVSDTIESVDDPLLVTDPDDRILLANQPATMLTGKPAEGLAATALLADLAHFDISGDALPAELVIADRIFSLRRSPLRGNDGERRGWILHLLDISATRAAEREREAALEFLSHDMRSPQSSIISLVEQHRASLGNADLGRRIAGLARRTLALADNFVLLARMEATRFEPEEVELGDVLTEAADDVWPQASSRNIRLLLEGTETPHYLSGERDTLRRALANLLDNAVKFSPDDGIVRCSVAADDAGWVICVIDDSGPGIPPERQADLFGRYGASHTAPGSHRSAGLGLAYVAAAVARNGGEISYMPREPHGTSFRLRFPALA